MPARIRDGQQIAAGPWNTRTAALRGQANLISISDIQPRSLGAGQIGTPVVWSDSVDIDGLNHTYNWSNVPYPGWGNRLNWMAINLLGDAGGGTELSLNCSIDLTEIKGILILANVELIDIFAPGRLVAGDIWSYLAMFVIQIEVGGLWLNVVRTERYVGSERDFVTAPYVNVSVRRDVPIRTLVTLEDLPVGETTVTGVRFAVSCANTDNPAVDDLTVELRRGNISAMAFYGGTL